MQNSDIGSTQPYLIRAWHEWCTDNGLTPYITVAVDNSVQVPRDYVHNGEIVLNIGYDATTGLRIGNDYLEFKARFGGVARDVVVPIVQVLAIFARENSQGITFPRVSHDASEMSVPTDELTIEQTRSGQHLSAVPADEATDADKTTSKPATRPTLTRVK